MTAIGKDFNGDQVPFKTIDDNGEKVPVFTDQNAALINETLLTFLAAIFEKMPRIQANDRLMVDLGETTLPTLTTLTTLATLTTANDLLRLQGLGGSTINVTKAADGIPAHLSNVGALHLYDNIIVS